jgi:hypothetical protein
MTILIACEFSGVVRRAFRARGHEAWSCDLLPAEDGSEFHLQGDVLTMLANCKWPWDLMLGHPPCKFLALCQAWRRRPSKKDCQLHGLAPDNETWRLEQRELAVAFAKRLWEAPVARIALENPKSILSTRMAPKSQTIHPWQFGHGETKETWLWLKNLPPLKPTNIVEGREQRVWKMPPSETREQDRSRTYTGLAEAMAEQWGSL